MIAHGSCSSAAAARAAAPAPACAAAAAAGSRMFRIQQRLQVDCSTVLKPCPRPGLAYCHWFSKPRVQAEVCLDSPLSSPLILTSTVTHSHPMTPPCCKDTQGNLLQAYLLLGGQCHWCCCCMNHGSPASSPDGSADAAPSLLWLTAGLVASEPAGVPC